MTDDTEALRTGNTEERRNEDAEARRKAEAEAHRNDSAENDNDAENDNIWGGAACARAANVPLPKFYYLFETGALNGVVKKLGHRTFVGSRRGLRNLVLKTEA